jgi:hypothetical protein
MLFDSLITGVWWPWQTLLPTPTNRNSSSPMQSSLLWTVCDPVPAYNHTPYRYSAQANTRSSGGVIDDDTRLTVLTHRVQSDRWCGRLPLDDGKGACEPQESTTRANNVANCMWRRCFYSMLIRPRLPSMRTLSPSRCDGGMQGMGCTRSENGPRSGSCVWRGFFEWPASAVEKTNIASNNTLHATNFFKSHRP